LSVKVRHLKRQHPPLSSAFSPSRRQLAGGRPPGTRIITAASFFQIVSGPYQERLSLVLRLIQHSCCTHRPLCNARLGVGSAALLRSTEQILVVLTTQPIRSPSLESPRSAIRNRPAPQIATPPVCGESRHVRTLTTASVLNPRNDPADCAAAPGRTN